MTMESQRNHQTPLEMWVSDDDMRSWRRRNTQDAAPRLAPYPDGLWEPDEGRIYLVWEDDHAVSFT